MYKKIKQLKNNESGVIAIVVSVLMILILSLLVLAIAQNANREQRQSLDRQLSDQAFYNAESGINDVASWLYSNPAAPIDKNQCTTPNMGSITVPNNVDGNGNQYTCILYDKAPTSIEYEKLGISTPKVLPIESTNSAGVTTNMSSLTFSWDDPTNRDAAISGDCNFNTGGSPRLPDTCSYGGLRVEIVSPAESRDALRQRSFIGYFLPNATTGENVAVTDPNSAIYKGTIRTAACNGPAGSRRCSITVSSLDRSSLYLAVRSLYMPVNLSITGVDAAGSPVRFKGSQIVIDSTGKATDVIRRVKVRIPASSQYDYPGFALQTKDSICKVLNVTKESGSGNVSSDNTAECPLN